jgi:hypothetical protein
MFLNFDDLMEIKKQLNSLSKEGRTILERIHHMNERKKVLKLKHLKKQSLLNWWVVEQPGVVTILCWMQLTSAFLVEVLNLILLTGQRETLKSITGFLIVKAISEIDNMFLSANHNNTLNQVKLAKGDPSWTPMVIYPKVLWQDRQLWNKLNYSLLKMVKVFYKCIYYYFFPFLMLALNYSALRCDKLLLLDVEASIVNNFTPTYKPYCKHEPEIFVTELFNNWLY